MKIIESASLDSTNEYAKRLVQGGYSGPTFICADQQTAGRGQRGHVWTSPLGGIYATVVFKSRDYCMPDGVNTGLIGIYMASVVQKFLLGYVDTQQVRVNIAWPNDVFCNDRKIAGILTEVISSGEIVQGIGINIYNTIDQGNSRAVNLAELVSQTHNLPDLSAMRLLFIQQWNEALCRFSELITGNCFEAWVDSIGQTLQYRNENVNVFSVNNMSVPVKTGTIVGINKMGALVLRSNGQSSVVVSGSVRPAGLGDGVTY